MVSFVTTFPFENAMQLQYLSNHPSKVLRRTAAINSFEYFLIDFVKNGFLSISKYFLKLQYIFKFYYIILT